MRMRWRMHVLLSMVRHLVIAISTKNSEEWLRLGSLNLPDRSFLFTWARLSHVSETAWSPSVILKFKQQWVVSSNHFLTGKVLDSIPCLVSLIPSPTPCLLPLAEHGENWSYSSQMVRDSPDSHAHIQPSMLFCCN